jgi:hypothetical protein
MHFLIKRPPFDAMMQNSQKQRDRLARLGPIDSGTIG